MSFFSRLFYHLHRRKCQSHLVFFFFSLFPSSPLRRSMGQTLSLFFFSFATALWASIIHGEMRNLRAVGRAGTGAEPLSAVLSVVLSTPRYIFMTSGSLISKTMTTIRQGALKSCKTSIHSIPLSN